MGVREAKKKKKSTTWDNVSVLLGPTGRGAPRTITKELGEVVTMNSTGCEDYRGLKNHDPCSLTGEVFWCAGKPAFQRSGDRSSGW